MTIEESTHLGKTPTEKFYMLNTIQVRKKFLRLLTGIRQGRITEREFVKRMIEINRIQVVGVDGKSVYRSDQMKGEDENAIKKIAGTFRADTPQDVIELKFKNMYENLKQFCSEDFIRKSTLREVVNHIAQFYVEFMGHNFIFVSANNSIAMNMVNAMLRLYGLKGMMHYYLDAQLIKSEMFPIDFKAIFSNQVKKANRNIIFTTNASKFLQRIQNTPLSKHRRKLPLARFEAKNRQNGGIDLSVANKYLQTSNNDGEIKFHINPAMLQQLQNAPGFVPIIINIQPMTNLRRFLGVTV